MQKFKLTSCVLVLVLFAGSFFLGRFAAQVAPTVSTAIKKDAEGNWGLSFQEEGKPPVADASCEELKKYDAYYMEDTSEKVMYLTFDCGYENGNTPAILDALKKHKIKAAFFVVGNYLSTSPDLVKRMVEEGHIVGNHSYHHPDMTNMGKEDFAKELGELETLYEQTVGSPMGNTTGRPRENTAITAFRLPKIWGIRPSSGVLPMWTGIRTVSPPMRKPLKNF